MVKNLSTEVFLPFKMTSVIWKKRKMLFAEKWKSYKKTAKAFIIKFLCRWLVKEVY